MHQSPVEHRDPTQSTSSREHVDQWDTSASFIEPEDQPSTSFMELDNQSQSLISDSSITTIQPSTSSMEPRDQAQTFILDTIQPSTSSMEPKDQVSVVDWQLVTSNLTAMSAICKFCGTWRLGRRRGARCTTEIAQKPNSHLDI
jgi:hypothetical protein